MGGEPVPAGLSTPMLAGLVVANHVALLEAESRVLVLAAAWADAHDLDAARGDYRPLVERACAWGGAGTPSVSEYCAHELGALQGTGSVAARMLIADALDLRHRLPRLWRQVQAGQVRAWQARKVAEATRELSWEAAGDVDQALSGSLGMLPGARFLRVLAAAVLEVDPDGQAGREERARTERDVWASTGEDGLKTLVARATSGEVTWLMATVNRLAEILAADGDTDPVGARRAKALGLLARPAEALRLLTQHRHDQPAADLPPEPDDEQDPDPTDDTGLDLPADAPTDTRAARPRVVLYFHLSEVALDAGRGVVRPEHGDPLSLAQLKAFLRDTGCAVTVRPVLDPVDTAPVDDYEIPTRLRSALRLRDPADVFPYGTCTTATLDDDHTQPYVPMARGGPPGQTGLHNLAPLSRSHHRAVTFGGWQRRQPEPGLHAFRSPTGYLFLVTNNGTLRLGRGHYAHALWNAAKPPDETQPAV